MSEDLRIYDISTTLGFDTLVYPGDTPFRRERVSSLAQGEASEVSDLHMSAHSGTHIDAPAHFIPGGKTIDQYSPEAFVRSAKVVAIQDGKSIRPAALAGIVWPEGGAVLFRTQNSEKKQGQVQKCPDDFVHLSREAAELCAHQGITLIGLDAISIDPLEDPHFPAHLALLGRGILVLEGIDLSGVPEGTYTLVCLPLKIAGGEAAPVRAVLFPSSWAAVHSG
jgi:arylformamidase